MTWIYIKRHCLTIHECKKIKISILPNDMECWYFNLNRQSQFFAKKAWVFVSRVNIISLSKWLHYRYYIACYVIDMRTTEGNRVDLNVYTRGLMHALRRCSRVLVWVQERDIASECSSTSKVGISTFKCIAFPSGVLRSWIERSSSLRFIWVIRAGQFYERTV